MITVNITASGAVLTAAQPVIADGTAGGITARFHTDSVWQGLALTAVFRTARGDILMPLTKGQCDFPSEATEKCGEVLIGLFGTDGYRTLTSTFCKVKISLGTPTSGEEAKNYTPSLYEQFAGKFARIENMTVSAEKGDVAAVEKTEVDGRINLKFTLPRGATGEQGPQGEPGKDGADGKDGSDYILTDDDKQELSNIVMDKLGKEPGIEETVLAEQTVAFEKYLSGTFISDQIDIELSVGEKYRVVWNGTEYFCYARDASELNEGGVTFTGVYIGNAVILTTLLNSNIVAEGTGEPFIYFPAKKFITSDTAESHVICVQRIKTLNTGWLPDLTDYILTAEDKQEIADDAAETAREKLEPEFEDLNTALDTIIELQEGYIEGEGVEYLPTVSADDNGKMLQVVDGKWAAVAVQNASEVGM